MSRLPPVEEDDGRHTRQQLITTAGVAGESMAKYAPTHLSAKRKAADLTISESRLSRIKEDDASQSRQKDMPMASVVSKARVDVPATISDRWRALMVKMDAVRRFRSSLARFRSRKAKPEEHLIDDPSMSERCYSDDNETFRSDDSLSVSVDSLSVSVDLETEDEISSIFGSYRTLDEAARAFDVGNICIGKKSYNFHDPGTSYFAFPPQPSWVLENGNSKEMLSIIKEFVKKQAEVAARRDDPAWKRTYESRLQGKPVHSSARKGKNQIQETSGFKGPSYPRSEDWHLDNNDTFRLDDWLSVSVDWKTEDKISRWFAVWQDDLKRMEEGNGFIDLPHSFQGVRTRPGVKGFLVEIRPKRWKKTISLGTHDTAFPPLPPHLNLSIKEQALKGEQVCQLLEEKRQRHSRALLPAIEEGISRRFRDKDLEMENMKRQNLELAEHVKQLSITVHNWQAKARTNEAIVTALKSNLQQAQQAVALSLEQSKEGCGDSEADDAASSHHGDDDAHARTFKENRELREQRTCRMKGKNQNQETSSFESPSYPRFAFGPDFPCTTDGHLKQENQFSTIGISDTTQNCFQIGLQEILTMGRKGRFEGANSIEFLFEQAEDMSKVVGVGLQWSKVVVTKQFGVVVKHIGEHLWSDLWKETSFSPMRILIRKPPSELSMCNLTPEQSSKSFGVGLVGSRLQNNRVYVEDNQNQTGEMFPFIFELAEKMGLSENATDSNFQHPSGISSEAVEGEKNDHGGPLFETMEGGGETDQGGTSSEPMDPMDVGESSQGGNSGEPMEGVESGQGGPSSGPTEVGEQRDQQSSDFQLRFESLQAKGPQDSNENKSLTVIVIPEVGGTFYEGLSNRQVQPDCRIKGAAIAPWLKFKFEILGGERKITTTTETRCDLGGGQLTLHEGWDLGYCHDNITISLTCENRQAVQVSPGTVVAIDVMKRAMTETFTGSMSRAKQIASQANVQVQMPVVPIGIQAQGTLEVTDTIADSQALAVTVETSNTQFAGFNVNQLECAGSLVLNFLYPEEIVDVKARGKRQFIHAGINKTLWPTIVGKWLPLDREEARLYIFKTDRDIHSIGSLMRLHANMNSPMFMQQRYEVPFVINHAMSHIHYYEDKELRGPGVKSVDRVLTKYPEI